MSGIRESQQVQPEFQQQSTADQAYFNFLKSVLGIGIIAIPYSSYQTGFLWTIPLMLLILYCCYKSTNFLIDIVDDLKVEGLLYNDVARISLNLSWAKMIDILIIISQVGICIAYLIFLTQTIQLQFQNIGVHISKIVTILLTLIPIVPLTFIQNIHFFNKFSTMGMLFAVMSLLIASLYGWTQIMFYGDIIQTENPIKILNSFRFIGVGILAFEGILTVLPIRDSMINRFEFKRVFSKTMLTAFIIIIVVQQLTVISYGDRIKPIVLFNIANPVLQFIATAFYSISILLTYSLQLFPALQIIELYFHSENYSEFTDSTQSQRKLELWTTSFDQIAIRLIVTFFIYFIVYIVPDFSAFLNLLGSVFGALVQYIFPCMMHIVYNKNKTERYEIFAYIIILSFGTGSMIMGFQQSIRDML